VLADAAWVRLNMTADGGSAGQAGPADEVDALLAAAASEFEAVGLSRASLDVIARAAGVSRSTLYRRFVNKEALILAVLQRMLTTTMHDLDRATRNHSPQEAVVEAFAGAVRSLNSSRLYRRVFFEEQALVRGLVTSVREWTVGEVAGRVRDSLRRSGAQMPDDELLVVSELLVRIARSYVEIPSKLVAVDDESAMRDFAKRHLADLVY
jgi:TetR/AcrR family transcriptional regulator